MISRIFCFNFEMITPNGIYEKVSATLKSSGDLREDIDTLEVRALKRLIKEKGMPRPVVSLSNMYW